MSTLLLVLDILSYNLTEYKTYFILLIIPFMKRRDLSFLMFCTLFLDLFCFSLIPFNTIIILLLYFINQLVLKKSRKNLLLFLILTIFNYIFFITLTYLINNYQNIELIYLLKYMFRNSFIYILSFLFSYKFFSSGIKLAR